MNTTIEHHQLAAHNKPERKFCRVLRALLAGPVTRLDAERYPISDHCLPSTVSELNRRRGIRITSTMIYKPGFSAAGCYIAEYHLADESRSRALELIGAGQ